MISCGQLQFSALLPLALSMGRIQRANVASLHSQPAAKVFHRPNPEQANP